MRTETPVPNEEICCWIYTINLSLPFFVVVACRPRCLRCHRGPLELWLRPQPSPLSTEAAAADAIVVRRSWHHHRLLLPQLPLVAILGFHPSWGIWTDFCMESVERHLAGIV